MPQCDAAQAYQMSRPPHCRHCVSSTSEVGSIRSEIQIRGLNSFDGSECQQNDAVRFVPPMHRTALLCSTQQSIRISIDRLLRLHLACRHLAIFSLLWTTFFYNDVLDPNTCGSTGPSLYQLPLVCQRYVVGVCDGSGGWDGRQVGTWDEEGMNNGLGITPPPP